ncbi:MAG: TetR/AcrR family transcriptional regulator [Proteobacteria bacterium]|nr:TetR/AcrR family transcriptional regulator [Pseudomonadota bacterium]
MTSKTQTSIRDHYREETRARILDAAIAELSVSDLEALTMAGVAARAGVTERTVFRHFPSRDALIQAVWPRLQARVRSVGFPHTAEDLIATPRRLFPEFDKEERLVRASAFSAAGREVRRASNAERQQAMRDSVRDAFPDIEEPELTRLAAIVQLIDSAYAWAVMKDFWDLDGNEAALAASQALVVLLGRRPAGPARKANANTGKTEKRK